MDDVEQRTMARVARRLVPFLILCYFIAYLDRVNVGFAALEMNKDLGLTASAFGFGAGIFFLAYFVFEVPSNLMLARFGARRWIARIMFTWGLLSGVMAFVTGATGFYVVRVLLGAAEAGFFPGMIFFLTLWFPAKYRARIIGYFMAAIPLSTVIGAPVSGALLGLNGVFGLRGWQWLFILEAVPALILSVVVLMYLTDKPADATWLAADERRWLVDRLAAEERQRVTARHFSVAQALLNPRVLALSLVYFGAVATNYGLSFFLPQIVKAFGLSNLAHRVRLRHPVRRRRDQHCLVGPTFGREDGAALPHRLPAVRGRRRPDRRRVPGRSDDEDGGVQHCRLRHLRRAPGVLDAADGVPVRFGGGRRHRDHQLDRQPVGLRRPVGDGLGEGSDRQLHRRAAGAGGSGPGGNGDRDSCCLGHDTALEETPAASVRPAE